MHVSTEFTSVSCMFQLLGEYEDHRDIPTFHYGAIAAHGTPLGYEQRRRVASGDTFIQPDHGTYLALKVDNEVNVKLQLLA